MNHAITATHLFALAAEMKVDILRVAKRVLASSVFGNLVFYLVLDAFKNFRCQIENAAAVIAVIKLFGHLADGQPILQTLRDHLFFPCADWSWRTSAALVSRPEVTKALRLLPVHQPDDLVAGHVIIAGDAS